MKTTLASLTTHKSLRATFNLVLSIFVLTGVFALNAQAAKLSESLQSKVATLADNADLGTTIVAFNTNSGLNETHLNVLRGVGVVNGKTFPTLGMVAATLTAGQVRALANNSAVRSIWSNDRLYYYMHQAREVTGVNRLQTTREFTTRNGGMPVSGAGDFSIMVIDSGVDATHADLQFGSKTIQNVQTAAGASTLPGFTPNVSIENVPNTDQTVGHGTHCAGIIGGTGVRSGGLYPGVAPGAKLIGAGLGAGLFVLNAIGAWEWGLANQARYNIRVVSNSYGSAGAFNPDNPLNIASKAAYDRNISVVFAGSNSGPTKGTLNTYAKAPWVIAVAAGTKEGTLADFSSRGTPRSERLTNEDPLDDFDAPTITAPGTGRAFETNASRFTSAMVSTRSTSNITANGLTADADLPASAIPFYTQISGTSMATPFIAGTIALMLDADPTLDVDTIKQILVDTASRMPGYDDFEVGAGYVNAFAAVDKVFNRSRNYRNIQQVVFNTQFGENRAPQQAFSVNYNPASTPGPTSSNARTFTVAPNQNVLDIFATVDTVAEEGTGNPVGLRAVSPSGQVYGTAIELPVLDSGVRQILVQNPEAGTWTVEVRGVRSLAAAPGVVVPTSGAAAPGLVEGTISQIQFILPTIADISGHAAANEIEAAIKNRVVDTFADGTFRPNSIVTRGDLAGALLLNSSVRQTVGATPRFSDVSGDLASIAEAITANGSTLRDFGFAPKGLMSANGSTFNPGGAINRLDLAVALVRALGHDAEAVSKANSTIVVNGTPLSDNAQIPGALRGYVQLAIDKGILEAFPAEARQVGNTFTFLPGPRFEPTGGVTRAILAIKLNKYRQLFNIGG